MEKQLKRNIPLLYLINVAAWFMLLLPVIVPFYESRGLNATHVFTIQAVYSFTIVLMEIPSGYFADVIGRKKSIILGLCMGAIGYAAYTQADSFFAFIIAEILLGIGNSFISGSDSALLYDSLKHSGGENNYIKAEGRMVSAGNFSEALAGVSGGILAAIHISYAAYGQTLVLLLAIPAAFMLTEPPLAKKPEGKSHLKNFLEAVKFSYTHRRLWWNIVFSAAIGAATLCMAWCAQFIFERTKIDIGLYGALWTALNLLVAIGAFFAFRITASIKESKLALYLWVTLSIGFALSALIHSLWVFAVLAFFYLARGVATPLLRNNINRESPSEIRATILSVRSFIIRLLFTAIAPLTGYLTDNFDIGIALLAWAAILFLAGGFALLKLKKHNEI